jgi:MFS family permease
MKDKAWERLGTGGFLVGAILLFFAFLSRSIVFGVVAGALTLGGLALASIAHQRRVQDGEPDISPRRRAWLIGICVFALIYCAVVGTIAAVTGHASLVVTALLTTGICGGQLWRVRRADRSRVNATNADQEGKPDDKTGPLSPAVETVLDTGRPLLRAQPIDNGAHPAN